MNGKSIFLNGYNEVQEKFSVEQDGAGSKSMCFKSLEVKMLAVVG